MADVFDVEKRREIMRAIRGQDTTPERIVRNLVRSLGYRCRRNVRSVLGKPDLVFASQRKVIFVHGCFWHRHCCRKGRSLPQTRRSFWAAKLLANKQRDALIRKKLKRSGWRVLTVWECQTAKRRSTVLLARLSSFLGSDASENDSQK